MNANTDIVGLVLAAGEGTRLRPLTLYCPKPLLPFHGRPILDRILANLRPLKLGGIGVNTHHLADALQTWLAAHHPDVRISHEPTLLGSGGGVRALCRVLPPADHVLYHNGDIFTDASLPALIAQHRMHKADVTMLLSSAQSADGNVGFDAARGRIVTLPGHSGLHTVPGAHNAQRTSFAGILIMRRHVWERLPIDATAPCIIRDAITPLLLEGGAIHGVLHHGHFSDLGTPARWLAGLASVQEAPFDDETVDGLPEAITLQDNGRSVRFLPQPH